MKRHDNPWAGLASYQDPASAERQLLFCGRATETNELGRLVDDNIFVTLYGKSGIGKTSLLNAGVFPLLRREGYLPLSIRLGMEAVGQTFQQCITRRIGQACTVEEVAVVEPCADEADTEWLWNWFARARFSVDGRPVFPVVVFDQMEEVLRDRRAETETLMRQIHYMMDEGHALQPRTLADGSRYDYDFNFRFVATVREDDLYRLEDSLDRCYLPGMKNCRYRLHALSDESATEVVLRPGEGVLDPADADRIAEAVIDMARSDQDGSISTNLLSLLCSRLYAECRRKGAERITLPMLGEFMQASPIVAFYNEATKPLRAKEKTYIEEHLVDSAGRRNSVSEGDFRLHVRAADRLMEGDNKILQRTSVGSDAQDYRIELIHDSFCEPLIGLKEKRRSRRLIWGAVAAFLALVVMVILTFHPMRVLRGHNWTVSALHAHTYAAYSRLALAEGDTDLAVRIALVMMPRDTSDLYMPYVHEAEGALRAAMMADSGFAPMFAVEMVDMDDTTLARLTATEDSTAEYLEPLRRAAIEDGELRVYGQNHSTMKQESVCLARYPLGDFAAEEAFYRFGQEDIYLQGDDDTWLRVQYPHTYRLVEAAYGRYGTVTFSEAEMGRFPLSDPDDRYAREERLNWGSISAHQLEYSYIYF